MIVSKKHATKHKRARYNRFHYTPRHYDAVKDDLNARRARIATKQAQSEKEQLEVEDFLPQKKRTFDPSRLLKTWGTAVAFFVTLYGVFKLFDYTNENSNIVLGSALGILGVFWFAFTKFSKR